ncbi:tyrosine-type recombinase/integrase [Flagellimonas eckloniae]|uniref:Tyr recombinase domain-containing protein n=1 Tax=Flagellimonas eckloniae TaxID=346185 RepID=A0A0Q0XKK6_9FLAO|nr:site-specific integrase [Allomuricauda eckloniae]KQC31430.1 hypothetical protein AAY42_17280 [Allomuricauda eckloniae]
MDYKISIVLDKRRQLNNYKYPIKVRIYSNLLKKAKRIGTNLTMTENQFINAWGVSPDKVKSEYKASYRILSELYKRAEAAADSLDYFDFDKFKTKLLRKASDKTNAAYHFNKTIKEFESKGRIGAASSYRSSMISLLKYDKEKNSGSGDSLSFHQITPTWLEDYESYMIDDMGRSITTVAIYTRTLRVIFNNAIRANDLEPKYYPFGKGKFEIPEEKTVKKTLTGKQIKEFYQAKLNPLEEKARDYWFFSYVSQGMNFKDIAILKFENIQDSKLVYYRAKTKTKRRTNIKKIEVPLNRESQRILECYGTNYREDGYVFPILQDNDTPEAIFRKVNNFIRATNQQLKRIAKKLDFPSGFSTYWARHSFATNMVNNGASIEFVSEALNHSDISVTQNYLDGFEDETKKDLMDKLLNFD